MYIIASECFNKYQHKSELCLRKCANLASLWLLGRPMQLIAHNLYISVSSIADSY